MIPYPVYPVEERPYILGALILVAICAIVFLAILWPLNYAEAKDKDGRFDRLEESVQGLKKADALRRQTFQSLQFSAVTKMTATLTAQVIPSRVGFTEWRSLRVDAAGFAAELLRGLVERQRKALYKSDKEAAVIERATIEWFQSKFRAEANSLANRLKRFGRRGNNYDEPYNCLSELIEGGPKSFDDVRRIATSITTILDNDGYAAF
jgi:hypothetical protein